ncbi:MAG: TraR/DksA C4-type zinc finger protein [Candidatus Marinimicrobia bacterium]|nr:TraR/DksA C4-type zinc finger protein [Candidatus Neomarinimicrobiota bacterium]
MDKVKREKYKKILLKIREDLVEELMQLEETIDDSNREGSSAYSFHMADVGTDASEREKAYLWLARENKYLRHILEALKRVETESYGTCMVCGEDIEEGRLESVPHTQHCFSCKSIVSH